MRDKILKKIEELKDTIVTTRRVLDRYEDKLEILNELLNDDDVDVVSEDNNNYYV